MTLKIKPVKLNRSIYVRVPNDIVDLVGIDGQADITLKVLDAGDEFFLIYSIHKPAAVAVKLPGQIPSMESDASQDK